MIKGKATLLNILYEKTKFFKSVDINEKMDGATPPSVFIGSFGYPKVFIGPMTPPIHGNTEMLDAPEKWLSRMNTPEEIAELRLKLVRGKRTVHVKEDSRFVDGIRDIALAKQSTEMEIEFSKKPTGGFFHEELQPFGPSAPIKSWRIESGRYDEKIEKAYYDTDLKSSDAIMELYKAGTAVSVIQRALSVGAFGLKNNRKLVPTKWAITAVDSNISETLLKDVREFPVLEEYRVYECEHMRNKFVIIFIPQQWSYESMEAFYNAEGTSATIFSDYEMYHKKKEYASIGGCYYSIRSTVAALLIKERKQAAVIILREAYKDYIPLGVWLTRECTKLALEGKPMVFQTIKETLNYAGTKLTVPMKRWIEESNLLKTMASKGIQTSLNSFLNS